MLPGDVSVGVDAVACASARGRTGRRPRAPIASESRWDVMPSASAASFRVRPGLACAHARIASRSASRCSSACWRRTCAPVVAGDAGVGRTWRTISRVMPVEVAHLLQGHAGARTGPRGGGCGPARKAAREVNEVGWIGVLSSRFMAAVCAGPPTQMPAPETRSDLRKRQFCVNVSRRSRSGAPAACGRPQRRPRSSSTGATSSAFGPAASTSFPARSSSGGSRSTSRVTDSSSSATTCSVSA